MINPPELYLKVVLVQALLALAAYDAPAASVADVPTRLYPVTELKEWLARCVELKTIQGHDPSQCRRLVISIDDKACKTARASSIYEPSPNVRRIPPC